MSHVEVADWSRMTKEERIANRRAITARLWKHEPPPPPLRTATVHPPLPFRDTPDWTAQQGIMTVYRKRRNKPKFDELAAAIMEAYGLSKADLLSRSHEYRIAHPRQLIMYLAARVLRMSGSAIGRKLKRDHSTVHNGIRNVKKRAQTDPKLRALIAGMEVTFLLGFGDE